jgi:hypothetical protein
MMTREEFDILIGRHKVRYAATWSTQKDLDTFPVLSSTGGRIGRCRYCGKRTTGMFIYFDSNESVVLDIVARLMRKSNSVCNLDCLYGFIVDRTPEILEEITR